MILRLAIDRSFIWTFLAGLTLWLSLGVSACGGDCSPVPHVDVFPLDLRPEGDAGLDAASDGASRDAAGTDARTLPDGSAPSSAPSVQLNCGSLAAGCVPGQSCPPACDCVLARQRMGFNPMAIIDQCILSAGTGTPSVEVRYRVRVTCS